MTTSDYERQAAEYRKQLDAAIALAESQLAEIKCMQAGLKWLEENKDPHETKEMDDSVQGRAEGASVDSAQGGEVLEERGAVEGVKESPKADGARPVSKRYRKISQANWWFKQMRNAQE
jgi:hypothetical protein